MEHEEDKDLHFIAVKHRKDLFTVVNDYVEAICEMRDKCNDKGVFKDQLEEYIQLLSEEIYEMVHEDVIFEQLMRCADMLSKKEHYE